MNRLISIVLFLVLFIFCSKAQNIDSLSLDDFLKIVGNNYPLIKKAELYDEFAEAYQLKGKGTFDTKVSSDFQTKNFTHSDYFTIWRTEVEFPTSMPIDFSLGYENNDGSFLNSENSVPDNGLIYGTLNLSLLRGLMFDEQRYNVQLAELKGVKSQIDKEILTREIVSQSIKTYIEWSAAFQKNAMLLIFMDNVQARHQLIVQLYVNGDKPAIDTIESIVNFNSAQKIFLESANELNIKRQKLGMFMWDESGNPLNLKETISPEYFGSLLIQLEVLSNIEIPQFSNDPAIRKLENAIDELNLNNRLEKEYLKPQVDLKYNTILNLGKEEFSPSFSFNDYKYGIKVAVPIQNRKTKGAMRLNQVLVEQTELDQLQYQQRLVNKYEALSNSKYIQEEILKVINNKINNSQSLYEAEVLKFNMGESSVFFLNQRERKLLEAKIDMVKSNYSLSFILNDLYFLKMGQ